jgi:peptide-methionine (R)-S-oxide reductase
MDHLTQTNYQELGPIATNHFFDTHYQRTKNQFLKIVNETMIPKEKMENPHILKYLKEQEARACKDEFKYPAFHILPKLHKGLTDLKSRPVVGAVDWFTSPISKILSIHLQDIISVQCGDYLLKRTTDTISRLHNIKKSEISDKSFLVTMDIESLYTNIDIKILEEILQHFDPYLSQLCKFVNENNKFEYLGSVYHQSGGIAMGTNSAPEMANIYLLTLLDTQILQIPEIKSYCRYLDDLFFVWNGSESGLNRLIEKLQVLIPGIQFSFKYSQKMVEFLDLCIVLDKREIHHYTHQKLLNKYAYITPSSCHPLHVFKSWIVAELNRYKSNSSKRIYYQRTKDLFYQRLLDRGYPRSFLNPLFDKHYYVFPQVIAKPKTKTIPFILRYSKRPGIMTLGKLLRKDIHLKSLLPNHRIFISWKKSRSIQDILCQSRLSENQIDHIRDSVSQSL